jgi:hypothetical protein
MKIWITSLSGAIALSFTHFLLELWRGFLDFSLILPDFSAGSTGSIALFALVYTLVFAFWLLGLANARQGKRGGIIAALIIGALFWVGIDLGTIFFYCRGGCSEVVFDIETYAALIVGALALYGLATNLRPGAMRRPSNSREPAA